MGSVPDKLPPAETKEGDTGSPVRALLLENLEWTERYLRAAKEHIDLWMVRIDELMQAGESTEQAERVREILHQTREMHIAERDSLLKQLEGFDPVAPFTSGFQE